MNFDESNCKLWAQTKPIGNHQTESVKLFRLQFKSRFGFAHHCM